LYKLFLTFPIIFFSTHLFGIPEVVSRYRSDLNAEWKKLETELVNCLGINYNDWKKFKYDHTNEYVKHEKLLKINRTKQLSPMRSRTRNIVDLLVKKVHLDTRNIDFITY